MDYGNVKNLLTDNCVPLNIVLHLLTGIIEIV